MFRDVPGCSGMFRNVPACSMFRVLSTPTLLANNSQHCSMLHVASVCTPCSMLLNVVGQSLKPVKLLAPGKRTKYCCVRLQVALKSTP